MADDLPPPDHHKTSWPELVGYPYLGAGLRICYDRPEVTVFFYALGGTTRPEPGYNPKRVVVFYDANNAVVFTPVLG